ncbi:KNDC1 [Bugula neritina]|uniref:KNDC1 n=1 Tax=Bugula neritina TaxID=10212 RepID=A0A7J7KJ89_BUGNE|nr:KNDC1 [Bugula neritina]
MSSSLRKIWNATKTILTIGSGKSTVQYQKTGYSIISYIPKSKKLGKESITPSSSFSSDSFSIIDHRAGDIAEQLTLMDQTLFQNIHPVNFMNTLAQGIGASLVGSNADTIPNQEKKLLFHSDYVQLVGVSDMIQHSRRLAHWVTAEVISAANVKTQVAIVSKFLHIAKICKDLRNFATSMAIKDGLDHPLIDIYQHGRKFQLN